MGRMKPIFDGVYVVEVKFDGCDWRPALTGQTTTNREKAQKEAEDIQRRVNQAGRTVQTRVMPYVREE